MAVYTIGPGDRAPLLQPGDRLNLARSGDPFAPFYFRGVPNITVLGAGPGQTVIRGSRSHGDEDPAGIRFADGCDNLETGNYTFENPDGRGLFLTKAPSAYVHNVEAYGCGIECAHIADCPNGRFEDFLGYNSRNTGVTSEDKQHFIYFAGNMSGASARRLVGHHVTGSAIQLNGADHGVTLEKFTLEELDCWACGGDGTPPFSFLGASNNHFSKFRIREPRVNWWIVMFQVACHNNVFQDYTVPDASDEWIHEEDGSGNNTFEPGAGWSPGDNPQPPDPPKPPNPPDIPSALAHLDIAEGRLKLVKQTARIVSARSQIYLAKQALKGEEGRP